ncbi:oncoprotein-induced transcript 3 protein-like isoform X2 [Apostichopus japonicus]|uniref:oncoprotein-induced transcript 3 protein-like isoform X2 n=1 Tax=Stichopus japonicus TaxID=307972 RepID=UPI003AB8FF7D
MFLIFLCMFQLLTGLSGVTFGQVYSDDVILRCGASTFQVDIPVTMINNPSDPTQLFLSEDKSDSRGCMGTINRESPNYISINSSLTGCGTAFSKNQTAAFYRNTVKNKGQSNMIVYESIEIPIICQYDRSELLSSKFKTFKTVIRKHGRGSFVFDFGVYSDISYATRLRTDPVEPVMLGSKLYFRAELKQAAANLKIYLRSCRATPTSSYDGRNFQFIRNGCGINDAAVRMLIPKSKTQADFELTSFRFSTQLGQAVSQVWVHCEVVVCDEDFECIRGCEVSRSRRAAAQSQKVTRVNQGPFILPTEDEQIIQTLLNHTEMTEA